MKPSKFSFKLSSGWGPVKGTNDFQLVGNQLQVSYDRHGNLAITPSPAQWQALWKTCEVLDIWNLSEIHAIHAALVQDARKFHLEIEWAGRYVRSSGLYHEGPEDFVKRCYQRIKSLHEALQALVPPDVVADIESIRE